MDSGLILFTAFWFYADGISERGMARRRVADWNWNWIGFGICYYYVWLWMASGLIFCFSVCFRHGND